MSYLLALLSDFKDGVEKALDGLEQSHRWDVLKGVQAYIEAAEHQAKMLQALADEADKKAAEIEQEFINASKKYAATSVELDKAKLEIDRLNALIARDADPVLADDPVEPADPVAEEATQ